mgnify:CR=1 FL=1
MLQLSHTLQNTLVDHLSVDHDEIKLFLRVETVRVTFDETVVHVVGEPDRGEMKQSQAAIRNDEASEQVSLTLPPASPTMAPDRR